MNEIAERLPVRLRARARQLASIVATSLWVAPAVAGSVAAVLALVLVQADPRPEWLPGVLRSPDAVRAALTSIVGATIAATSLVVTGTIVALQLATGQFSPRLLRDVLTDGGTRWSLAALVGTIVYTLVLVTQVNTEGVPQLASMLGLLLGGTVVAILVFFVHHLVGKLRLESILADVTARTLAAVRATHQPDHADVQPVEVPDDAVRLRARRSGYVQAASLDALAAAAASRGQHVVLRVRVGDELTRGTTAAYAWPARPDGEALTDDEAESLAAGVDRALALGVDRTLEGDPGYGLRHLVDIGLRGVSPGVNDPTTAEQTIHLATRVLVELAQRPVTNGAVEVDGCWAVVRRPTLEAHLELAQGQLLHYGGSDPRVAAALAVQLRDVVEAGTAPERFELARRHADRIRAALDAGDLLPGLAAPAEAALDRLDALLAGQTEDADETAG